MDKELRHHFLVKVFYPRTQLLMVAQKIFTRIPLPSSLTMPETRGAPPR